jgi:hypothetical protein
VHQRNGRWTVPQLELVEHDARKIVHEIKPTFPTPPLL